MHMDLINRFVRRLSGQGALDNVEAVLAARASIDAELSAFVRRVAPMLPVAAEAAAA